ncbi:hypothetical protein OUZ56_011486 [Daphnia magna]|uniref:Reverse transcriptase domain-containing protein n=1 Tax=Daphnia magna TaxID=35525 RepID=A0ABQ9Z092_9CRUS|nr:hypothetical protein OUZ56_011486 [Daphnia magna]
MVVLDVLCWGKIVAVVKDTGVVVFVCSPKLVKTLGITVTPRRANHLVSIGGKKIQLGGAAMLLVSDGKMSVEGEALLLGGDINLLLGKDILEKQATRMKNGALPEIFIGDIAIGALVEEATEEAPKLVIQQGCWVPPRSMKMVASRPLDLKGQREDPGGVSGIWRLLFVARRPTRTVYGGRAYNRHRVGPTDSATTQCSSMEGEDHYRRSVQRNGESRSYRTLEQSMGSGCGPVSISDVYPPPRIEGTLVRLEGAAFISIMDLQSGYWQVPIRERNRTKRRFSQRMGYTSLRRLVDGFVKIARPLDDLVGENEIYLGSGGRGKFRVAKESVNGSCAVGRITPG